MKLIILGILLLFFASAVWAEEPDTVYRYTLDDDSTPRSYDEAAAVACVQGIVNRDKPVLWVDGKRDRHADVWREKMTEKGRWLFGKKWVDIRSLPNREAMEEYNALLKRLEAKYEKIYRETGQRMKGLPTPPRIVDEETVDALDVLVKWAGDRIKGAVIWDPEVPATFNAAFTSAGAGDLVVLSPDFARKYLGSWKLEVKHDLRGRFDGSETGSAKNDVYRWVIREYLDKGKCSKDFLFLNTDAWGTREKGDLTYVLTRDWAVANRGFVFDLSPWGTETPGDDPDQPLGTDLATYKLMLEALDRQTKGRQMTELAGFFCFEKYSDYKGLNSFNPVATEWETVFLVTPYNVYQNTADGACYNKSFHSKFKFKNLKQRINKRPKAQLENKTYVCILMADYDSTVPLYQFLPDYWSDERRGEIPLSWGIDPNLINTYPDLISYYYETATDNDYFVADATCAGYFNPSRILPENMPLFVKHNQKYYKALDLDISPMVLDVEEPSPLVKDAFSKFSPRGYGAMVDGQWHGTDARNPQAQIWKGMPITDLSNTGDAASIAGMIKYFKPGEPRFFYLRIVWNWPWQVIERMDEVKKLCPEYDIEIVDPYTFFDLRKQDLKQKGMVLK
ncbi:MAG: hypothetical protein J5758_07280 [Abditibacteriota bacterium]|nr:hypothetical protein [Abditibacteriota bacterium]